MQKSVAALVKGISTAALTTAIALSASVANAFTLTSSSGTWTGTEGGLFVTTNTVGGENQLRWGAAATIAGPSGLGFTGVGNTTFAAGDVFQLGTLRHFNNPILGGSAASAAYIRLDLAFADIGTQQFDFTLAIDETPNGGICPYFSILPCSDRISWNNAFASNSFMVGGTDYTLELLGFSDTPGGTILSDFISQEGGTSEAYLFAKVTALTPPTAPAQSVPEPSTIAGAFVSLFLASRYRNKKQQNL